MFFNLTLPFFVKFVTSCFYLPHFTILCKIVKIKFTRGSSPLPQHDQGHCEPYGKSLC